uniref:Uncharacterized protein MANES_S004100 n=1 Tax=Rhizophora mucronata TaxID=61149 RepID=A0A2P2P0H7_RHIMU
MNPANSATFRLSKQHPLHPMQQKVWTCSCEWRRRVMSVLQKSFAHQRVAPYLESAHSSIFDAM